MNGSARRRGLLVEVLEQAEDGFFLVSPVQDVARLNDDEVSTDPSVDRVDRTRQPEGRMRCGQVPVQVSDRDDPGRRFEQGGIRIRSRLRSRGLERARAQRQGSEARQALDLRVLVAIASAFGLGLAVQASGLAELAGGAVMMAGETFGPVGLLIVIYLSTTVLNMLVTNAASAALVFPVALSAAEGAGQPTLPFVLILMIAASASFISPIGYQTNIMVYGPGGYRFGDFTRFGLPLSLIVATVSISMAWFLWL